MDVTGRFPSNIRPTLSAVSCSPPITKPNLLWAETKETQHGKKKKHVGSGTQHVVGGNLLQAEKKKNNRRKKKKKNYWVCVRVFLLRQRKTSRHKLEITRLVFLTAWKPPSGKMRNGPEILFQFNLTIILQLYTILELT